MAETLRDLLNQGGGLMDSEQYILAVVQGKEKFIAMNASGDLVPLMIESLIKDFAGEAAKVDWSMAVSILLALASTCCDLAYGYAKDEDVKNTLLLTITNRFDVDELMTDRYLLLTDNSLSINGMSAREVIKAFFQLLNDIAEDKNVSRKEIISTIKDCLASFDK